MNELTVAGYKINTQKLGFCFFFNILTRNRKEN